jgi:YD repeat-containing protein
MMAEPRPGDALFVSWDGRFFAERKRDPKTGQGVLSLKYLREDGQPAKTVVIADAGSVEVEYFYDGQGRLARQLTTNRKHVDVGGRSR